MRLTDFINLDLGFYRSQYGDLTQFSDEMLRSHYSGYGYFEGRLSSPYALKEQFIAQLHGVKTLEIGPFFAPMLRGGNVKYLDVLSTDEMIVRAKSLGGPYNLVPNIDYVRPDGSLSEIPEKFDAIISSHNLEHQPDLIDHLKNAHRLLTDGGKYYFVIPHKSYCFDATLPASKISEIINAHFERRKIHTVGSVIEHRALTTHNDTLRHWSEPPENFFVIDPSKVSAAIEEFNNARGSYIDVHAWQFTPFSFSNIINCLIEMKYIPFSSVLVNGPARDRNEFTAVLSR